MFLVIKCDNTCYGTKILKALSFLVAFTKMWIEIWFYNILSLLAGDVELNSGPPQSSINAFSIGHWNLNSISAHIYEKIILLEAYIAISKFDVICIPETFFGSDTSHDDNNLEICGRNLIRCDHPSNNKRGGICIYYVYFFVNVQYLQECIDFEMKTNDKVCNFISLDRSPSQTLDGLEICSKNVELNLGNIVQRNLFLVVPVGNFNAKSGKWHCQD